MKLILEVILINSKFNSALLLFKKLLIIIYDDFLE